MLNTLGLSVQLGQNPQITGSGVKTNKYVTAGSFTETIPAGYTTATIEVWGGGGGTGAHYSSGGCCPYDVYSSAGGSGGYSRSVISVAGQGGKTLGVTVGAGGAGSSVNYYGSTGSSSSVASGTLSITTVTGGGGAPGATQINSNIGLVTATASCSGTNLTVTAPTSGILLLPSIEIRGGSPVPVLFGTVTKTGGNIYVGTVTINQSQTFASQSITFAFGYGGLGGIASGGTVNTNGNEGAQISTSAPVAPTIGITGLFGGPFGNGAGNDSATGSAGAVYITYQ
jgi:hypothetical protein